MPFLSKAMGNTPSTKQARKGSSRINETAPVLCWTKGIVGLTVSWCFQ